MSSNKATTSTEGRDLILSRIINAPRNKVFKAWTEPKLLKQWFAPLPWTTAEVETDVRVGGSSLVVMRSPDGKEFPNRGVYLEVVPNERLVFTDAFTKAWEPSEKPFMTVVLTFEDSGVGISAEHMSKVFEPYFTTKASGSGLGLLIVRRIVREHGGEIELSSGEGEGLTITIRLPLRDRRARMLGPGDLATEAR